ncbi:anti-sigma factor family protein [Ureibacillus sp. MALMAid1270]|uniref:anti-sigma factor family protein n=1 Tax=Ureibacillus sp. MALMAid1270 TaxID=3411629 RepID=UPI003BA60B1F
MNCLSIEEMYDLIDGRINGEKANKMNAHIQSCSKCSALLDELQETEIEMFSLFPSMSVDVQFTNSVINHLPVKKPVISKNRDWRISLSTIFVSAALFLLVFWSVQDSMRKTSSNSTEVTISVKDVNIMDALIEVTLVTSGYYGEESFFDESNGFFDVNNISLVLPSGVTKSIGFSGEQSKNEYTFKFPLFDVPHAEFELIFDFKRIYGIDGHWTLDVPIDRKELLAQTENVPLRTSFEKDGIHVNFIRAQHGPDHTLINFETKFTEDMASFVEQQVDQYTSKLPFGERVHYGGYRAQILYEVVNANGQTLDRSNLEDTVSTQNDRYASTETLGTYPKVDEGGYVSVIGAKFELPTNVRYELSVDQLPFTFDYKDTEYEVILLPDGRLEISSDVNTTTINNWHVTVDNQSAWDTARLRKDDKKQYITITMKDNINLDSIILYGQTETKLVYFDEAVQVSLF